MALIDIIKNTPLDPVPVKVTTQIVDGKPVVVSAVTGKVLTEQNAAPSWAQTTVLDSEGKPLVISKGDLDAVLTGATVLPEVEITATPLTAFGLSPKMTYLIIGIIVLAGAYFVWKKYGK